MPSKFSRAAKLFLLCLIVLGLAGNIAWMMLNFYLLVLAYVPVFALAAVALFLRGALMNMAVPVYNAYCMEMVPPSSRATFAGLEMMTWSCGWAIRSYFSGHLREAVGFTAGFNTLFACMAGLYVTSIILFYLFFGRRRG